jgi:6-phospho-beta-glucosidase
MVKETGKSHDVSKFDMKVIESISAEGYAGVALNLIEALNGNQPSVQILNVPNHGAITGMDDQDVVEIPTLVEHDHIQPMVVGEIPSHCLGLIQQIKHFEHLTIGAAVEKSYSKALLGLTLHPLVRDFAIAKSILNEYISRHAGYFLKLH